MTLRICSEVENNICSCYTKNLWLYVTMFEYQFRHQKYRPNVSHLNKIVILPSYYRVITDTLWTDRTFESFAKVSAVSNHLLKLGTNMISY